MTLAFFIAGTPVAQGNHRQSATGRTYETTKGHAAWRRTIAVEAMARRSRGTFATPVKASFVFQLPRPRTSRRLWPSVPPDLSKLVRAVEDGLVVGGVLADDALIVAYGEVCKVYAEPDAGEPIGVHVTLESLPE